MTCQNGSCQRTGTVWVRVWRLGDRHFCYPCEQSLTTFGLDMKRIDAPPAWRQRSLRKDMTGVVA